MKLFKMSITNGILNAPAMIVEAKDAIEAEIVARHKSGLGKFQSWNFCAIELNNKNK